MAQDLRAVPRHGIIAPKEAVRMVLEQTAARQAKLLSLLRREFGLSAGLVKRLKWQNALFVNDAPAHTDAPVMPGDRVRVVLEERTEGFEPEPLPLSILYEDECFLAVDKPSGMLVHPSPQKNSGTLAITMLTAYPLSKSYLRGRKFFNVFFVFTMLFSGGLIASYINMTKMGLNGTIWAVLFPAACSPYTIILMRTFFEQIPTSMEESAFIDGANDFHVFTKITIPLSKPIISTVVLLFAVNRWNSWFNEFIYLTDKKLHPLQLVIRSIVLTGESEGALQAGEVVLGQSLKYAVVILAMIPMLILYPLIQKYLVKGIMLGAVKG